MKVLMNLEWARDGWRIWSGFRLSGFIILWVLVNWVGFAFGRDLGWDLRKFWID